MKLRRGVGKTAALAVSLGVVIAAAAESARATVYTYTIDPQRSSLTVTGNLTGNEASPQTFGSLTTSYSGTIVANVGSGKIAFTGGSSIVAADQPSEQQPYTDATFGSAPANYGRTASSSLFGGTSLEAIRDLKLDMWDTTFGDGIAINNGNFSSTSLQPHITDGTSDVLSGNTAVETDLSPGVLVNRSSAGFSTLEQVGQTETLTLRLDGAGPFYSVYQTYDTNMGLTGTLVATRTVTPEPGSCAALLGIAGVAVMRRRGRRAVS
jgi:hypothetical protein